MGAPAVFLKNATMAFDAGRVKGFVTASVFKVILPTGAEKDHLGEIIHAYVEKVLFAGKETALDAAVELCTVLVLQFEPFCSP